MKKKQNNDFSNANKQVDEAPVDVKKEVLSWIKMLVTVVIVVLVITQVVIINARVPSGSMENTIMTRDRLIGFRFSYWFQDPERGDIVLFKYPVDQKILYIKRVIGLPGETIEIVDGEVYVDGEEEPLQETYLKEDWIIANDGYVFTVPEDCYLMLGDNRNNSSDARFWSEEAIKYGLATTETDAASYTYVPKKLIKGKAIFKYFKGFEMLTDTADY